MARRRTLLIHSAVVFLSLVLTMALIEGTFCFLKKRPQNRLNIYNRELSGKPFWPVDENTGYRQAPLTRVRSVKKDSLGHSVYDVVYEADEFGRRRLPRRNGATRFVCLFGGSFIYGEGLQNENTLGYQLHESLESYNVYNYSCRGYGPNQMLAILENRDLRSEMAAEGNGIAVYLFLDRHVGRAIGDSYRQVRFPDNPYYVLENGEVRRQGVFGSRGMLLDCWCKLFYYSNTLSYLNIHYPLWLP